MARTNVTLADGRQILCNFLRGTAFRGSDWSAKEKRLFHVSTAGNWNCRAKLHRICWIHGVAFNPVRFWHLHSSLTGASLLPVRSLAEWSATSFPFAMC